MKNKSPSQQDNLAFLDINESAVATMGKVYSYDQLNRLKTVNAYTNTSGGDQVLINNTFATAGTSNAYEETFSYDPNGNIMEVHRYGHTASSKMDEQVYHYTANTNKLTHVSDNASLSGNYGEDIDNQSANNYHYDEIGNLKHDEAEEIDTIKWNVYGKITEIKRKSTSSKPDLEFTYDAQGQRLSKIVKPRSGSGLQNEESWTYTYYTRDAQGNVMAVYERKLSQSGSAVKDEYILKEHDLYGSSRLGIEVKNITLGQINFSYTNYTDHQFTRTHEGSITNASISQTRNRIAGDKSYELSNHLGNVMVVVSDKKMGVDTDNAGTIKQADVYTVDVISSQDYYAFGAMMPGRKYSGSTGYRYAFGGKEKNDEISGEGNSYDYGARMYDPRLGRWNKPDLYEVCLPGVSTYAFGVGNPIRYMDGDGNFVIDAATAKKYPLLKPALKSILAELQKPENAAKVALIVKAAEFKNKEELFAMLTDGSGPKLKVLDMFEIKDRVFKGEGPYPDQILHDDEKFGKDANQIPGYVKTGIPLQALTTYTTKKTNRNADIKSTTVYIDDQVAKSLVDFYDDFGQELNKVIYKMVEAIFIHEVGHVGDELDGKSRSSTGGVEAGDKVEDIYNNDKLDTTP